MSSDWSRRQFLQLGGLSALTGIAGCSSLPAVGTLGFRLRNYTSDAYDARITIQFYGQTAFEQTYQLPAASSADPYVHTEPTAVSTVPTGVTYTVSLFLDGTDVQTLNATMDCTDRETQPMDEEISIDIGFGGDGVRMTDSWC